jgi:uncharacterized SAM-binding protein YcdF (DUF218 family)
MKTFYLKYSYFRSSLGKAFKHLNPYQRLVCLALTIAFLVTSIIPIRIAIAFHQAPVPQAIFVLGGDDARMRFAAEFWRSHKNLDIWVSDYQSILERNRKIFQKFDIPDQQLHLDGRATDTVTNFTTLAKDFTNQKLQHVYLFTSDYHMRRARAIATIVLGSQGIVVTPVAVTPSGGKSESLIRVLRDCGRSVLWIFVGKTGSSLNPNLKRIDSA